MTDTADEHIAALRTAFPAAPPPGPIVQSVTIAFRAIYAATLLLGLVWLFSNVREISPGSQAVVLQFGRIVRSQSAGLLLALPQPFEQVRLLPGTDRQLSQEITALPEYGGILSASSGAEAEPIPPQAAPYLTGDGNVVLLDSTLIYHITDPKDYILAEDHVVPALNRLFRAAAVQVTAGWRLNDFIVAQTGSASRSGDTAMALRGAVRDSLLKAMNDRLQRLDAMGAGLGVSVDRIDMTAWLPPEAKLAFDAVLTAGQQADQEVAAARTDAERLRQGAEREGDRLLSAAEATAKENTVNASVNTSNIAALEKQETPESRENLLSQAYRDEVGTVLNQAGTVMLVDPKSGARFVLPGKSK